MRTDTDTDRDIAKVKIFKWSQKIIGIIKKKENRLIIVRNVTLRIVEVILS